MFQKNINRNGRLTRVTLAVLLLIYALFEKSWIALILSLFTFIEAMMSWCVLNQILGINQCPLESSKINDKQNKN